MFLEKLQFNNENKILLGRTIGHFLGDGSINSRDFEPSYCNTNMFLIQQFVTDISTLFPEAKIRFYKLFSGYQKTEGKIVRLQCRLGRELIENFGTQLLPNQKRIPKKILRDTKMLKACLTAIFDDDGSVGNSKYNKLREVVIQDPDRKYLESVQTALSFFDITSHIYRCKVVKQQIFQLCITNHVNLLKFAKHISFSDKIKRVKLENLLAGYKWKKIRYLIHNSLELQKSSKVLPKLKRSNFFLT